MDRGGCGPLALQGWAHRCPPCQALPGSLAGGVPLRPPAGTGARHSAGEVSWPPPESQLRCPRARSPPGAPGQGDTGVSLALCLEEGGTVRSGHYPQYARGVGTWVSPLSLHPDRSSPHSLWGHFYCWLHRPRTEDVCAIEPLPCRARQLARRSSERGWCSPCRAGLLLLQVLCSCQVCSWPGAVHQSCTHTGAEHLDTKLNASRGLCLIRLAVALQPPRFGKGNALPQHQAHHQHCSPALCRQRSVAPH